MNHAVSLTPRHQYLFKTILNYTHLKNLRKGKSLHAHLIKSGSSSCIYLSNSVVNFYAKCSLLREAHLAFDDIHHKDTVSWNCLINGYSQLGRRDSSLAVLSLLKQMRQQGTVPNSHTFAGVFSAASHLGDKIVGKQAHCLAVKLRAFDDVFVGSSLMNMYCKAGDIGDAHMVFVEMPERNSVSWATMISGYASQRLAKEALGLFRMMLVEGEDGVNEFALTSVLSAFTLPEFISVGKQIHCLSMKYGLFSIVPVANALVTMYAKCGSLDDACQAFESSNIKEPITWSAMVTGYAQNGNGERALKLFSEMHVCGVMPSEYTLVGVLNACSDVVAVSEGRQVHGYLVKLGFESQMYIMTALVDMYAKCGKIDDARSGFDCLGESDIVLWTSMIAGYVQNGDSESAMNMYCRMRGKGIMPNELTMASVLKACSSLAALEQGKQIHAHTVKYGFSLTVPVGSALATMYAKCGSLTDGDLVFTRMPDKDVASWNSMISGLSQNGHGTEALQVFEEMRMVGGKPDYVTFVNILSACSHMGLVEKGWDYFKMMSGEFGIEPGVEHDACMVDILGRAGKLYEAKEFILSATIDHGLCLWRILLSACRNYRNYELGAYAGEKLMELGSLESSAYVLLSSIYSALGRVQDVERVRHLMSLRCVTKEPGCSWIELKTRFHVFVVSDQLHPQIKEIREEVQKLSKLMKDEDCELDYDLVLEGL
ncbi:PREDICTED: pentatricopeptide repeat-containing protein At2g33680 [Ipomoea nil]|uniref:pentatricopeptide repeat-containing protein At2g33680 n=1 Tax=Ipomoea nil TaxID=35883 RepID=UPI000900AF2B|nr:PREDICTED: pentatricopeptide repeat-containing protein At2g33680 [Ipomoea nil]